MTYAHRSATPISTHDTTRIDDTRIKAVRPLITPALLQEWLPTPLAAQTLVENSRAARIQVGEDIADKAGRTTFKGVRLDIVLTDSMPVAALVPKPVVYPVDVAKKGVNGQVVLIVDVATDGSVSAMKVDRSAGDERLDAAALEEVKQWKFKPMVKNGKPVQSQVRVPIEFEMDGNRDAPLPAKEARSALAGEATGRASRAATSSSYHELMTSISASWQPPKPVEDDC